MSIELQSRISQIRESATKNSFQNGELLNLAKDCISQNADKELLHQLLDISHLSTISSHVQKTKQVDLENDQIRVFDYTLEDDKPKGFRIFKPKNNFDVTPIIINEKI